MVALTSNTIKDAASWHPVLVCLTWHPDASLSDEASECYFAQFNIQG
jgi:hypothetical protein